MLEKKIEFLVSKEYLSFAKKDKRLLPEPIKFNIPDWFKDLKHGVRDRTVKGCFPFLDAITSGYLLKMPVDYYFEHNVLDEGKRTTTYSSSLSDYKLHIFNDINLNKNIFEKHLTKQLGERCPLVHKNLDLNIHKILNPWTIKTPPGYSCLFVPPLNNTDDRFSIISGIVDTDKFENEINFPFIINGDKYPALKTTLLLGTPYVQVIPFKRDNWKMSLNSIEHKTDQLNKADYFLKNIINRYKSNGWSKKSWK